VALVHWSRAKQDGAIWDAKIEGMIYKGKGSGGGSVEERGRGRLLDYLMEFLSFPCYIERAEKLD
jgi:hypothetical protein